MSNTTHIEILNRWNGKVQFACDLETIAGESRGRTLGRAVLKARESDAVLRDADLSYADLSDADMRGAVLRDADLSGAVLRGAVLRDADLSGAVLRDADLSYAVLRDAVLRDADLSYAVLRDAVLRDADLSGAVLRDAVLRDADLSGAVLRDAVLRDADLSGAVLRDAVLRDADLSGAVLRGVPAIPNIHQAVYAAATSCPTAFDMGTWHRCETTHCRAGWVVTLAGEAGAAMEFCMGTATAAALIYLKSDPKIEKIPDFYCDNDTALADMKRLTEIQS